MARPTINQIANLQTQLTTTNDSANNRVLKAGDTMTGNLTFSGTGLRILGDFSNATATSRLAFQSSTANGNTILQAVPNGSATQTNLLLYANTDLSNTAAFNMFQNATESTIRSIALGTGSYTPLTFYTGGSERMRLDTSGNALLGTTSGVGGQRLTVVGGGVQLSGGTTAQEGVRIQRASGYATFTGINNDNNAYNGLQFFTGASAAATIDASSNVGIGTTSPVAKLHVTGNATIAGNTTINDTAYLQIPVGNTAQRPSSPSNGMIRFNTTTGYPEWYHGGDATWYAFNTGRTYTIEYLIVAGGGGGGHSDAGGGGGAGGLLYGTASMSISTAYTVTVGGGGTAGTSTFGGNGSNSSITGQTAAIGGGGGGKGNVNDSSTGAGQLGGSGGGGGWGGRPGGSGTSGQGNAGGAGNGSQSASQSGGGGGGAGAAGTGTAGTPSIGNGGSGSNTYSTWATATSTGASGYYAGGGGAGTDTAQATGGAGGGGNGAIGNPATSPTAGTTNTGGGGGGGRGYSGPGGAAGGSGLVIIRYAGSQRGSGGTIVSSGGYTYHTFTSSGTFTA